MKEPKSQKNKDTTEAPLPPTYKAHWDIVPNDDSIYIKKDLENIKLNNDENIENND